MKTTKSGVHFVKDKNSFNYENNNLFYQYNQMGLGKQYVGCASKYPPDLDIDNFAVGACDNNVNYLARLVNNEYVPEQVDSEQCRFVKNHDHDSDRYVGNVISNVNVRVNTERNVCTLSALDNLEFADIPFENLDEKEDHVIYIGDEPRQWFINIPVYNEFREKLDVPVFCDSGANVACIDANFAVDNFYTFIKKNTKKITLQTVGGPIKPKFVVYLSFPTKSGIIFKGRFYLVNDLPVDIPVSYTHLTLPTTPYV